MTSENADTHTNSTCSRRQKKLGKAFQNYRRSILHMQWCMMKKKAIWRTWLRATKKEEMTLEDWLWTEDDMDHFLQTVASFETHEASPVIENKYSGVIPLIRKTIL